MDLEARKIEFVQEFLRIQSEGVIKGLEDLLRLKKKEIFEKNLTPMNLDAFYNEIDESLIDSKNDKVVKASDLKSKYA